MIQRLDENHLLDLLEHFPAVAILGPRQVGKTTLAREMLKNYKTRESIYIDLELDSDAAKLENPEYFLNYHQDKLVIIDEVQRKTSLFPLLRALIDKHRVSGRFLLLGSASQELLGRSSETLAGRLIYHELSGFNLLETGDSTPEKLWFRGGLPNAYLMEKDTLRNTWFDSFVKTYIEREFSILGLNTPAVVLRRLLSMISYNQGAMLNVSSYARAVGLSVPTINNVLDFFEHAFIVRRLQPWFSNAKKRLVKSPKLYIRDSGMLHFLTGIATEDLLKSNTLLGVSWEGFVIEQIISVFKKKYDYCFYRTADGTECDLVVLKNLVPYALVEAKISNSPSSTKGLSTAISDLQTTKNFIVVPQCDSPWPLNERVTVCGLQHILQGDFL